MTFFNGQRGKFSLRVLITIMGGAGPSLLGTGVPNWAGANSVGGLGEWIAYIIKF